MPGPDRSGPGNGPRASAPPFARSPRMPSPPVDVARAAFVESFGGPPTVLARAPGRVELLGNHTDYNGGLVLAAAIDRYTVVVGRATDGREASVRSANLGQLDRFVVDGLRPEASDAWSRYVRGVAWAIQEAEGRPRPWGFEAALAGDAPLGAGLSSSASLQASVALFLHQAGLVLGRSADLEGGEASDAARMALAKVLRR